MNGQPIHDFSETELERYARHIILPEVGAIGQTRLLQSSVLIVGAGGLGAPMIQYLAAAGVGRIGIIDDDDVDLSNLQRQVVHRADRIGVPKAESARDAALAINPGIDVVAHRERLHAGNVMDLVREYDLVADGTDNFSTRFLLNDACYFAGRTLVSAALLRFDGQISTFKAHETGDYPCYRCLFPEPPRPGLVPSCSEAGVFGAVAGVVGCLQATEILKELAGVGESLSGALLVYDGLGAEFRRIKLKRNPACALCGDSPSIVDLSAHETGA